MSTRPVPRRESPWGLPEGDTRQPVAHRCNDRAEDVIQVFLCLTSSKEATVTLFHLICSLFHAKSLLFLVRFV